MTMVITIPSHQACLHMQHARVVTVAVCADASSSQVLPLVTCHLLHVMCYKTRHNSQICPAAQLSDTALHNIRGNGNALR